VTITLPKRLKPLFEDKARDQVVVAHRRWAKTLYQVSRSVLGTKHFPGALTKSNSLFWGVFPTYRQGKLAAWRMLKDLSLQTGRVKGIPNETELKVEFVNGSEIYIKGSDKPDNLRGAGPDGAFLDEWALQAPEVWTEIVMPALADKQGWSVKAFTPKGRNHAYDDYITATSRYLFPADTSGVLQVDELAKMKEEMSEDEFNQEMLCQFLYSAGQIYREFKEEKHVISPRNVSGEQIISIDYGLRNPTAILFGTIDYDGNLFITNELYEAGREVEEHARNIKAIIEDPKGVIDPSTNAKNKVKNGIPYSIYQEFQDNGIFLSLAPNSVLAGINLVKQMFTSNRLFIFDRCVNLIQELKNYRWKEKRVKEANLPEEPLKANDHACLAGATLVKTPFGDKPISEIKTGECVMTSNGWQIVEDSQMTGIQEIYEMTLSDGKTLKATSDHQIFTAIGKVRVDSLRYGDIINTWETDVAPAPLFSMGFPTIGTGDIIPQAADARMGGGGCIALNGNIISGRSLPTAIFIIPTLIRIITAFLTLFVYQSRSICRSMQKGIMNLIRRELFATLTRSGRLQSSGIGQKPEDPNIEGLADCRGQKSDIIPRNVWYAEKLTRRLSRLVQSFATLIAGNRRFVIGVKPLDCSVPVYNLTVARSHNYYANGILVSNCDSLRYLISSRFATPDRPQPKVRENTVAYFDQLLRRREQTAPAYL
jgi:hypothetical protein